MLVPPVVGVTTNGFPVHTNVLVFEMEGVGLIFTTTVNTVPVHVPKVGVTK